MLKGINPLLNAEVLFALCAMGHGDDLIIADCNFPSDSVARQTRLGSLLRIDNTTAAEAVTVATKRDGESSVRDPEIAALARWRYRVRAQAPTLRLWSSSESASIGGPPCPPI